MIAVSKIDWGKVLAGPAKRGVSESEVSARPHLAADRRHAGRERKADLRDARQAKDAAEAIGQLPCDGETLHLVVSGRFSLFDVVPATLKLAGCSMDRLDVATLGFSKRNVSALCGMVDSGIIGRARLLCSHYFAGTSKAIYDFAVEQFASRPNRMQFLSVRTHAKLLLLALADGRRITVESSANLRSCKNIEQATLFGSQAVHDFHAAWLDELFRGAA